MSLTLGTFSNLSCENNNQRSAVTTKGGVADSARAQAVKASNLKQGASQNTGADLRSVHITNQRRMTLPVSKFQGITRRTRFRTKTKLIHFTLTSFFPKTIDGSDSQKKKEKGGFILAKNLRIDSPQFSSFPVF
jgi:hypothetical protein